MFKYIKNKLIIKMVLLFFCISCNHNLILLVLLLKSVVVFPYIIAVFLKKNKTGAVFNEAEYNFS